MSDSTDRSLGGHSSGFKTNEQAPDPTDPLDADTDPDRPRLSYFTVQPSAATFESDKIRSWVERRLRGRVAYVCSGRTPLTHPYGDDIVQVDIDPATNPDIVGDVTALSELLSDPVTTIVYDPPFSPEQADTTYSSSFPGYGAKIQAEFDSVLRPGGRVIMLGFSAAGMDQLSGYRCVDIGLYNLLGRQSDWIARMDVHTPELDSEAPTIDHQTKVRMNTPVGRLRGDRTTQSAPLEMTVRRIDEAPTDPLDHPVIQQWVEQYLSGIVLDLTASADGHLHHDDRVWRNSPSPDVPSEFDVDPPSASGHFKQAFDSIVYHPEPEAFQRTIDGTGENTAVRDEMLNLVRGQGRLIQLGHTATLARDADRFQRHAVGIFHFPGRGKDIIGVVDEKSSTQLTTFVSSINTTHQQAPDHALKSCPSCGPLPGLDPAFAVSCPQCGATPEEMCLDPGGSVPNRGTPHEGIHCARDRWARDQLDWYGHCDRHPTGQHRRRMDQPVRILPG